MEATATVAAEGSSEVAEKAVEVAEKALMAAEAGTVGTLAASWVLAAAVVGCTF